MMRLSKKLITSIFGVIIIGVLVSCSPRAEKTMTVTDPQTGEKIDVSVSKDLFSKDKEINITNEKDGTSVQITKGEMPETMPAFIELYPGATDLSAVHAVGKKVEKNGDVNMVSFKTKDNPAKIISFYETKLVDHGFKKEASANFGPMQMATLANNQTKQALQLMITQEPNKDVMVQLIFATKQ